MGKLYDYAVLDKYNYLEGGKRNFQTDDRLDGLADYLMDQSVTDNWEELEEGKAPGYRRNALLIKADDGRVWAVTAEPFLTPII